MKWCVPGTLLLFAGLALAQDQPTFPWDRVVGVDPSTLTDEVRLQVAQLAERIPNYHGCRGSVAECIAQDPPDPTAQRLAGFVARQVMTGMPAFAIQSAVAERRRSAHPRQLAEIDLEGASCIGAETPLVTVVEFADFECPFCKISSPMLERIATARSDRVRFCFKYFPIRSHPRGIPSCVASLAAAQQDRFWAMHDCLYESAPDLSDAAMERCATQVGLDLELYRQGIAGEALLEEVMADKMEGQLLGVDRTPTIFVNGKMYFGELSEVELGDRVDEELDLVLGHLPVVEQGDRVDEELGLAQ